MVHRASPGPTPQPGLGQPGHGHPPEIRYRLHVLPPTRRVAGLLLPGWLAITIGRHVWSWRPLHGPELAHELEHVRQWQAYGPPFAARYLRASWRAWRAGGDPYRDNAFEVAARRVASRSAQVALHRVDVLEALQP